MNFPVVQRILGLLLMMFSITMLPPILVSLLFSDGEWLAFFEGFGLVFAAGVLLFLPVARVKKELRLRDGFLVVASFWAVLGLAGSAPLYFADMLNLTFTEAAFESISGLTTTGATVLTGLDDLPQSILYYRQQLQWLGGMGIIVLAVAVLPMLGVGGMQLYRAETPGPVKDTKLTPRITETAKALWYLYLGFTLTCMLGYKAAGMNWFDSLCHAFSTVAIGGFSTHDQSIGYFDSTAIDLVAIVFMFLAGINFSLHFFAWRYVSIRHYLEDPEFRAYSVFLFVVSVIVVLTLLMTGESVSYSLIEGTFQAVSIATTTGFTTADFSAWPLSLPALLVLASFIGGCAGSTAGGIKVIRWLLIYKQGVREIVRLVHPSAEIPVKLGNKAVQYRVVDAVWGFFSVYIVVFGFMMLAMMFTGLDQVTAFSAVAATLNNLGPGLGDVAGGFMTISDTGKWIAIAGMLLGRLEIFTLLVLITPMFWRP
ncbi:MAG: TrkH family potassium uptake protein [Woeseiaceae bacterium]|jgi:trk system potassium uptake protein TrkH|nr:TrkH family potassium uptake protein [Woeseiaceae bacterium]